MPYYDYARRGYSCFPNTCAQTSNEKFLPLLDPMYYVPYTATTQYPGQTYDFVTSIKHSHVPEDIKAHNNGRHIHEYDQTKKNPDDHRYPNHSHDHPLKIKKDDKVAKCNSCVMMH